MNEEHVDGIQRQMKKLLEEEQFDSVVYMGNILCSILPAKSSKQLMTQQFASLHGLYADALFHKQEYRHALRFYSSCLTTKFPKNAKTSSLMSPAEALLRFKLAKCMYHLDDVNSAIKYLEAIPMGTRSLSVHMLLGKLNSIQGLTRKAEAAYMNALKMNPYALEATIALAELAGKNEECSPTNLQECEIVNYYRGLGSSQMMNSVDANWIQMLVDAHIQMHNHEEENALKSFECIEEIIPARSHHCLLHRAKLQMDMENSELAMRLFVQARQCDVSGVNMMDVFARLLQQTGLTMQLNSLVRDLFAITESQPEPWLAAAWYSELKGDRATALQLCDRALNIDPSFSRSYLCRGHILMSLDRPEHAATAFSNASKLEKSIDAFEGLVEALCCICLKGLDKYLDAMNVARQALLYMPNSPRAILLLGTVLSLKPESRDRARKAFEKALSIQPQSIRANFGLVDLHIVEGNYKEAIRRLEQLSQYYARDIVFVKLGDVYTQHGAYDEALPQYHRALAINPNCAKAMRGVDRVEKYLRGEEPETTRQLDMNESIDMDEGGYHNRRHP